MLSGVASQDDSPQSLIAHTYALHSSIPSQLCCFALTPSLLQLYRLYVCGDPQRGEAPWALLEAADPRWAAGWRCWDDPRPQATVCTLWSRLNWLVGRIPLAARFL